jgi:hypothetical protein
VEWQKTVKSPHLTELDIRRLVAAPMEANPMAAVQMVTPLEELALEVVA